MGIRDQVIQKQTRCWFVMIALMIVDCIFSDLKVALISNFNTCHLILRTYKLIDRDCGPVDKRKKVVDVTLLSGCIRMNAVLFHTHNLRLFSPCTAAFGLFRFRCTYCSCQLCTYSSMRRGSYLKGTWWKLLHHTSTVPCYYFFSKPIHEHKNL